MPALLTYQDTYEHLLDVFSQVGKNVGVQDRRLRRAIIEAYRLLPSLHDWEYYRDTGTIITEVPVTHSGVTYTASTKRAVLSSGSWSAEATSGSVLIDQVRYPVSRRVTDGTIELEAGPAENYTGSVEWQRHKYLLPLDVGDVIEVLDPRQHFSMQRVTPSETFWWTEILNQKQSPSVWSLFPSQQSPGRHDLYLSGSGTTQRTLRYQYRKRHTNLPVSEIANGTVSVTGDVATFSSGVLTSACVGSVLRIGTGTDYPTSDFGKFETSPETGDQHIIRPAESELIIAAVNSATEAVLLTPITATVSTRGYTISSHVDVNYEGMWVLFLRLCEEQYDILTRAETPIRNMSYQARMQAFRSALIADAPGNSGSQSMSFPRHVVLDGVVS